LQAPLSPEAAAPPEEVQISLNDFSLPVSARPLVVEGAGGVLVPLNRHALMVDLMMRLALPVVLVARSTLGTINHTLLSLEALRARRVSVVGVVLNGSYNRLNRAAIEHHGQIPVLAELPLVAGAVDADVITEWAAALPSWTAVRACASG
jgi:dethiobiotin synthetase